MRWKPGLLALVAAGLISAGATAADVQLVHDKGFWSAALQEVGDAAGEATGVQIVETASAQPEQYKAFIQSSVASGDMPEMFTWWTGGVYRELVESGAVANLDPIWDEMIASGDFDESVRDFYSVDGHAYGVPLHLSRWIVLYNKAQFAEAGVEPPQTWDELIAVAEKLKAAGITPFNATTQDGWRGFIWFEELMLRTNPEAYNGLHDGSVAYDSDAVQARFQIWSDWYAKGWFSRPALQRGSARLRPRQGRDVSDRRLGDRTGRGGRHEAGRGLRRVHHAEPEPRAAVLRHPRRRPDHAVGRGHRQPGRGHRR